MSMVVDNANPLVYSTTSEVDDILYGITLDDIDKWDNIEEQTDEPITSSEVFEIIRGLRDPEHPTLSLEQLRVVTADQISVNKGCDGITRVDVEFTPTIPTCSVATLIGLTIRTKLQKCICGANGDVKINVNIKEGTHDQEQQVNKQLNDKERCQAAIENPNLQKVIRQGIFDSDPPLPSELQLIPRATFGSSRSSLLGEDEPLKRRAMSLSIVDEDFDIYNNNNQPPGKRCNDRRVRRLSSVSLSRLMTCPISHVFVVTQDELGHGATATVRKVIHKRTGEEFALKSLPKRDLTLLQKKILLNEIEIFLSVDHPNICRLAYVFEAPSMVHLVMELCRGPDLHMMIHQRFNSGRHFNEVEVADIIAQVLYAINYLHMSNIVHRDIKPSHFIFTCGCPVVTDASHVYECPDRRLKLFDFGLARRIGSSKFIRGGTLSYMAPECLEVEWESRKPIQRRVSVFGDDEELRSGEGQHHHGKDSEVATVTGLDEKAAKCDIWGVGVICYLLLTGKMPFESPNVGDVLREMRKIDRGRSRAKFLSDDRVTHISEGAQSFLGGCLQVRPAERFTARQALNHSWLTDMLKSGQNKTQNAVSDVLPWNVIESMRRYAVANSLRKAALNMVASGLTSREVHDLENAFVKIDIDHDGVVQFSELLRVIAPSHRGDLQSIFRSFAKSHDSSRGEEEVSENDDDFEVEYSQFLAAAVHMRSEMFRDKMREIFGRFDIDGNGTISEDELKMILSHSPSTNNDDLDAEVAELLAKFDKDGNGVIDYEEFLTAMDDDEGSRDKTWIWAQRHEIHNAPLLDKHSPYVGTFAHAPSGRRGSPLSRASSTLPKKDFGSPRISLQQHYQRSPITRVVRTVEPLPNPIRSAAVCCERVWCNVM